MNSLHLSKNIKSSLFFPSIQKLLLASALFFLWGWVVWPATIEAIMTDWYPIGFPLAIRATGLCDPSYVCIEFNWQSLVADIAFWYVVSAVLIHTRPSALRLLIYFLGALLLTAILPILLLIISTL